MRGIFYQEDIFFKKGNEFKWFKLYKDNEIGFSHIKNEIVPTVI